MEEHLNTILEWAARGTLDQFRIEAEARLGDSEYSVEKEDDGLLFYRNRREGGFLGIGGRTVQEPVMRLTETDAGMEIEPEPLDREFVEYLASGLRAH